MIIDAKDLIIGRICTIIDKRALLGETIDLINTEEAVITGSKKDVIARYLQKKQRGQPVTGPFIPTQEDKFVKRIIRGMLPYKQEKGASAFRRIKCHRGIPESLKEKKAEIIEAAHIKKVPNLKFIKIKEVCKIIGDHN